MTNVLFKKINCEDTKKKAKRRHYTYHNYIFLVLADFCSEISAKFLYNLCSTHYFNYLRRLKETMFHI